MRSLRLEAYKKTLTLTKEQRDILVGLLLGDGCLEVLPNGKSARLKVEYSKKQEAYIYWLHTVFRSWVIGNPKRKMTMAFGNVYEKCYFTTLSSPLFKEYFDFFYPNRKKIIPTTITDVLTPVGLAVWFMDDGSTKSKQSRGRIICTHAFSYKEVLLLCSVLDRKFNLQAKPRRQKDGIEIYISGYSSEELRRIIEPYVIPSMIYKLP